MNAPDNNAYRTQTKFQLAEAALGRLVSNNSVAAVIKFFDEDYPEALESARRACPR
jgi:hypothetical protein